VVTVLRRVALLKLQMDPSRADRSGAELGTNCTGDGGEGTGGAGGAENSIKPEGGVTVPADVAVLVLFGLSDRSGDFPLDIN